MTLRRRILRTVYPLLISGNKLRDKNNKIYYNQNRVQPTIPIYNIVFEMNDGTATDLLFYKGKKILIVNTASDCGYTNQYEALQKLHDQYKITVIAFPSNDFKHQEKGTDEAIAQFCKANYGIRFPLAKKSVVIKKAGQNKIFDWLSNKSKNGWLNQSPSWNFCKYLINEEGMLTHYFEPAVEPLSKNMISVIQS